MAQYAPMVPGNAHDSSIVRAARIARAAVDSQIQAAPDNMILVAGLADGRLALVGGPDKWPDSTDVSYDIFKDHAGHVRFAYQSPYSQSGDWSLVLSHYFDARGATLLLERQISFFNGCWNDATGKMIPIRETTTAYLDSTGRTVARDFVRTTFEDEPAPTRGCNTTMRTSYSIYPTWDSLATATGLARIMGTAVH